MIGYLADPSRDLSKLRSDKFLHKGARFFRDKKSLSTSPAVLKKRYPDVYGAFDLYGRTAWRMIVDAMFMGGADIKKIAQRTHVPQTVLTAYQSIFFDVNKYLNDPVVLAANVFCASQCSGDGSDFRDYTWKMFAYTFGEEAFVEFFFGRNTSLDRKYFNWLKESTSKNVLVNMYQETSQLRWSYNSRTLDMLSAGKAYWDLPQETMGGVSDIEKRKKDFVNNVQEFATLELMSADALPGAVESRDSFSFEQLRIM